MGLKRNFDIAVALPGVIILALPTTLVALTMSVYNRTKPFYKQKRVGKNGKPFTIYKIKTMTDDRDEDGNFLPDPERTKPLAAIFRKARIDELPQLLNVLKGEMSLVGPRPVHLNDLPTAKDETRHAVRPGLTGPAQVIGKNRLSDQEKLDLDHKYVDEHTFWGDLKLIAKTLPSLIKNRHISHFNVGAQLSNFASQDNVLE